MIPFTINGSAVPQFTAHQPARGLGLGDASPLNVNPALRGAELRIAETRVNRALRKAYGIGICSLEETGSTGKREPSIRRVKAPDDRSLPRLRDQLLLLIHQYDLEGSQVKRYALQLCGTTEAGREKIREFVTHLDQLASEARGRLLDKLAPYAEVAADHNGRTEKEAA